MWSCKASYLGGGHAAQDRSLLSVRAEADNTFKVELQALC